MELPVLSADPKTRPWYAEGLAFTCTQCGNCCTGGPGYVWLTREEIVRLASYLQISPEEAVERYCRKLQGKFSLNERRTGQGTFDCIFLQEEKIRVVEHGQEITRTRRTCQIYPVRPLQCRTWPFWPENLSSRRAWNQSAKRCPGMNTGQHYTLQQIQDIRDAEDWPPAPPSSSRT
jgi:uncharacterized protein